MNLLQEFLATRFNTPEVIARMSAAMIREWLGINEKTRIVKPLVGKLPTDVLIDGTVRLSDKLMRTFYLVDKQGVEYFVQAAYFPEQDTLAARTRVEDRSTNASSNT